MRLTWTWTWAWEYLHHVTITVDSDKDTDVGTQQITLNTSGGTKVPQKLRRLSSLPTCFHLILKYLASNFIGFQRHNFFSHVILTGQSWPHPDNISTSSQWHLESVKYGNLLISECPDGHNTALINTQHSTRNFSFPRKKRDWNQLFYDSVTLKNLKFVLYTFNA